MAKKKEFNIKLYNPKYVKGQPGVEKTTLTVTADTREEARDTALAYARKTFGAHYELA